MSKTMMDGYPDDPWINELSDEINSLVNEAERRIANAPLLGRHFLERTLFERDRLMPDTQIFDKDPYNRTERINLN